MEKKIDNNPINKKSIALLVFVVVLAVFLFIFTSRFRNYSEINLLKNSKEIFNVSDLTIDSLKYNSTEKEVVKHFGKPSKEKKVVKNGYSYKILTYSGLKITLKEYYDDYTLNKVEVTSRKYKLSRRIRVGNRITSVMNKFRIDNKKNEYLYANYSAESLKDQALKDNVYYGIRSEDKVEYVNRDKNISNEVDIPNNIARLTINYKHGIVKKISWSYDVE